MPEETVAAPTPEPSPNLLIGQDGTVYRAPEDKVAAAIATGQYRPLTPQEELEHRVGKEEAAKGAIGSLEAAGKSGLNQLLFGVPSLVAEHGETPQEQAEREAREKYHEAARAFGGALGFGGSLFLGAPIFKGAAIAGEAVSRGIVPAAELAKASLGVRLAAKAADMATQGAIVASPQAVVQAAFGDPQQAAETLLWGVGAGAALGGAGELLSAAGEAATEGVRGLLGSDRVQEKLGQFATDRAAKAIGAERGQLNKLSPEAIQSHVDFAFDEGLIKPGMSRADIGDAIDAAHDNYGKRIGGAYQKLDDLIAKGTADTDLVPHALKPGEMGDAILRELAGPELHMPMLADQRKALETIAESANLIPTTTINGREVVAFDDASKFVTMLRRKYTESLRRAINEGGVKGPAAVTPLDEMRSAAYGVARQALNNAAKRVSEAAAEPTIAQELVQSNKAYMHLAELDKWAATRERQAAGNRMIGLTDFLHMGHGPGSVAAQSVGAAIGGAIGGLPGAAAGAFIGKVPGALLDLVAKHWAEDKGLVYLSALARRAAKEGPEVFSAVIGAEGQKRLQASMQGVQDTIRKMAIGGIQDVKARGQEHMKALLGSTTGLTPDQSYNKVAARVTQLATNPEALATVGAQLSSPYASTAPEVADAYQTKLAQSIQYLYQWLPKSPTPPAPFSPDYWTPSASDKMAFHDRMEIVANPMSAMRHVSQGTLSNAHLDALRNVYPVIYGMMQQQALSFAAEHPDVKLPLPERQSVAKLLGAPLNTLDSPQAMRALQATYAEQPPQQAPSQKPPRRASHFKNMPSAQTSFGATLGAAT